MKEFSRYRLEGKAFQSGRTLSGTDFTQIASNPDTKPNVVGSCRRGGATKSASLAASGEARLSGVRDDDDGDAVVEAAILFPVMIMIFAALVLLAIYLPARSALQRATQYAATAMATQWGDTWLFFDESSMSYYWENDKSRLQNVYAALFSGSGGAVTAAEDIVIEIEGRSLSSKSGDLSVSCYVVNRILYREIIVTAVREFTVPVNLTMISFPETIPITVTSTAVVHDGDEFIRNVGIAVDFAEFINEKFGLTDLFDSISSFGGRVAPLLGW